MKRVADSCPSGILLRMVASVTSLFPAMLSRLPYRKIRNYFVLSVDIIRVPTVFLNSLNSGPSTTLSARRNYSTFNKKENICFMKNRYVEIYCIAIGAKHNCYLSSRSRANPIPKPLVMMWKRCWVVYWHVISVAIYALNFSLVWATYSWGINYGYCLHYARSDGTWNRGTQSGSVDKKC